MDILAFLAWTLALMHGVALFFPVNAALMALAFKVQNGPAPIPYETNEFWYRSAGAALALAILSAVMVGLAYLLVGSVELPGGPVHLLLLLVYVPAAVFLIFWLFALDDVLQALSIFGIYVFLPGSVLVILAWILKWFDKVRENLPWLLASS